MAAVNITISATTALSALLGVGVGVGLLLVIIGWRGVDPNRRSGLFRRGQLRRAQAAPRDQRQALRIGLAVAVGVLTGVATGWVVGAVLAGLAVWALPRVLGRDPEHARRVARIEAIATWTEMLRDTLSAAAGLEQAILATAPLAPPAIRGEITDLAVRIENGDRLAPSLRHWLTSSPTPPATSSSPRWCSRPSNRPASWGTCSARWRTPPASKPRCGCGSKPGAPGPEPACG